MELIFLMIIISLTGSAIAGFWDLLTTEVPDEIPVLMASAGVFGWYFYSLSTGYFAPLFYSIVIGTAILIAGMLLYKKGHWGGADALILAAIAYTIPLFNSQLFMPLFILNLTIVGSIYTIIYAVVIGVMNRRIFGYFINDMKANWKIVSAIPGMFALLILFLISFYTYANIFPFLWIFFLVVFLTIFWRYGVVIEHKVFKKRILSSRLKPGDVVENMIWRGIAENEIRKIREKKKYVVIKEGVRFVPAFFITLVATLMHGNLLSLVL